MLCSTESSLAIALFITDTIFLSNQRNAYGGALHTSNVDLILQRSQFKYNTATSGGAIYSNDGTVVISTTLFGGNSATDRESGSGGAIQTTQTISSLVLTQTTFLENFASNYGGAISSCGYTLEIVNSQFDKNQAGEGGAIIYDSFTGQVELRNTTLIPRKYGKIWWRSIV